MLALLPYLVKSNDIPPHPKTYLTKFSSLQHVNIFSHLLLSYDKQEAVGCHKNGVWNSCTLCKYNKTTVIEQQAIQAAAFLAT